MYQLIESIRIENKQLHNIELHNKRFNKSKRILFQENDFINLENQIEIPQDLSNARYKCRIAYNGQNFNITTTPYVQKVVKTIRLIPNNEIDYSIKTDNRILLDQAYALREGCDDIIIVKNNELTDSWASNIILFDGDKWVTPENPLLKGTQREFLIHSGLLKTCKIEAFNLKKYIFIKQINALIDFDRAPLLPISNVYSL